MSALLRVSMVLLGMLAAAPSFGADVSLVQQPKLGKEFDAFPRVGNGVGPDVAKRINDVLVKVDALGRKAIADCKAQDRKNGYWARGVDITMLGPQYLSLVSHDDAMCGWAHPSGSSLSLVFDLSDGRLVDLSKLLPGLVTKAALSDALDGAKIGTVTSSKLISLYRQEMDKDKDRDAECKDVVAQKDDLSFIAYPDAGAHGLVFDPVGIERVVQACFESMTLPVDVLAANGTSTVLLEALRAARK